MKFLQTYEKTYVGNNLIAYNVIVNIDREEKQIEIYLEYPNKEFTLYFGKDFKLTDADVILGLRLETKIRSFIADFLAGEANKYTGTVENTLNLNNMVDKMYNLTVYELKK